MAGAVCLAHAVGTRCDRGDVTHGAEPAAERELSPPRALRNAACPGKLVVTGDGGVFLLPGQERRAAAVVIDSD